MPASAFVAVFPVIFLGELPDKTMFASLVMATLVMATRGHPFALRLGATAAFAVQVVIATTVGVLLIDILPHAAVELAVALTFFAGAGSSRGPVLRGGRARALRRAPGRGRPGAGGSGVALCSGSMRGRNPEHFGQSLSRRGKWVMGVIGVSALVIITGIGLWSGLHRGSYDQSRNGCINLSVVSSTGGAVIHACGGKARTICRAAYAHTDGQSKLTQTQCKLAGIGPSQTG